jgi:hypothetical protein
MRTKGRLESKAEQHKDEREEVRRSKKERMYVCERRAKCESCRETRWEEV